VRGAHGRNCGAEFDAVDGIEYVDDSVDFVSCRWKKRKERERVREGEWEYARESANERNRQ